jgi:hypothetical protein
MNENLSEIVKTGGEEPMVFSESDLDLPAQEAAQAEVEATPEAEATPATPVEAIPVTIFGQWFEANATNFTNINQVKVSIRGINPESNLIIAVKDGSGEVDASGEEKRNLRVFDNADTQPVLALKGIDMQVYNNGFRVICEYTDNIYAKCYGIRTGLIVVFCNNINGVLVPYNVSRVKRTDEAVEVVRRNAAEVGLKLQEAANLEDLQLRYKQSAKSLEGLNTNQDVVNWLLSRQDEIYDINHHLQIDNVIIETLE